MNDWVANLPEAISVPLLITGESNGEILYANSSFGTLAGVAVEDLIGKDVSDLQADHPAHYRPHWYVRATGELGRCPGR